MTEVNANKGVEDSLIGSCEHRVHLVRSNKMSALTLNTFIFKAWTLNVTWTPYLPVSHIQPLGECSRASDDVVNMDRCV